MKHLETMPPLPPQVVALEQFEFAIKLLTELSKTLGETEEFLDESHLVTRIHDALRPAEQILIKLATSHESNLIVNPGTPLACSSCFRTGAETYYLKRNSGKYAVLCFDKGFGCWEKSSRTCCTYTDQHQAQCEELAEYEVVYGDTLSRRGVCTVHVGAVLSADIPHYKIYPLDRD
jgi:hypothetical protein